MTIVVQLQAIVLSFDAPNAQNTALTYYTKQYGIKMIPIGQCVVYPKNSTQIMEVTLLHIIWNKSLLI